MSILISLIVLVAVVWVAFWLISELPLTGGLSIVKVLLKLLVVILALVRLANLF